MTIRTSIGPAVDGARYSGKLLDSVVAIAQRAGAIVMAVYANDFHVGGKGDGSPVTVADQRAEDLIVGELARLEPDIPIVAEERVAAGVVPDVSRGRFWLVDPLDGTKEFISRNGEFTVNIALVDQGEPVLGVVFAPAIGRLFGAARHVGAFLEQEGRRTRISCRTVPPEGLTVVASRSHGDQDVLNTWLAGRKVARHVQAGSSLKLCLVAAGEADLYPRFGRTMEWDIAAGHAILAEAGGHIVDVDGTPLRYGKPGFANPHFIVSGLPKWTA